jgi:hypothetical protein
MGMMKINSSMDRLTFYYSRFEKKKRTGTSLTMTFEWGELKNLEEYGISEAIHLGETNLVLTGIKNERLKAYYEKWGNYSDELLNDAGEAWNEVANIETDENGKVIYINGYYYKDSNFFWIEWQAGFETCSVEWEKYVTETEWENGYLPSDKPRVNDKSTQTRLSALNL